MPEVSSVKTKPRPHLYGVESLIWASISLELLHLATRVGRRPPILYLAAPSSCASVREAGTRRSLVCATWVKSQYCKVAPCLPLDGLSAKSEFSFVKRHSDSPPLTSIHNRV